MVLLVTLANSSLVVPIAGVVPSQSQSSISSSESETMAFPLLILIGGGAAGLAGGIWGEWDEMDTGMQARPGHDKSLTDEQLGFANTAKQAIQDTIDKGMGFDLGDEKTTQALKATLPRMLECLKEAASGTPLNAFVDRLKDVDSTLKGMFDDAQKNLPKDASLPNDWKPTAPIEFALENYKKFVLSLPRE